MPTAAGVVSPNLCVTVGSLRESGEGFAGDDQDVHRRDWVHISERYGLGKEHIHN